MVSLKISEQTRRRCARTFLILFFFNITWFSLNIVHLQSAFANLPPPKCSIGSLPGESGVSCTGAAFYQVAIEVPPGTAGLQPQLAVAYNSQAGNGLLGMGWALEGMSIITRCGENVDTDTFKGSINYDQFDRFCLDGRRLVEVGNSGSITEYRTEPDTYTRVKSYGTTNTGADYFIAEYSNGTVIEYGRTNDSKIEARGSSEVRVWAANKLYDKLTNYINYIYIDDSSTTGEFRISEIQYTGNTATGLQPYNFIRFEYVNRSTNDQAPFYQGGHLIKTTKLLSYIKSYEGLNLVRNYHFKYGLGPATLRQVLIGIELCDRNNICLPQTNFRWSDDQATSLQGNTNSSIYNNTNWGAGFGDSDLDSFIKTQESLHADAFFPNISALSQADDAKSYATSILSLGLSAASWISNPIAAAGFKVGEVLVTLFKHWFINPYKIPKGKLGDANGDGKIDIVGFAREKLVNQDTEYVWLAAGSLNKYSFQKKSFWTTVGLVVDPQRVPEADEVKIGDFNGDGCSDVLTYEAGNGRTWLSNCNTAFVGAPMSISGIGEIHESALGDFNGDGKTDVAVFTSNGHVHLAQNGAFVEQTTWGLCGTLSLSCGANSDRPLENLILGDVNGDGKTDIVKLVLEGTPLNLHAKIWLTNKEGTGWANPTTPIDFDFGYFVSLGDLNSPDVVQPGDFNGDGKMDLAVFLADHSITTMDTNGDGNINGNDIETRSALAFDVFLSTAKGFIREPSFLTSMGFATAPWALKYPGNCPHCPTVSFLSRIADFNGDGKSDIMTFDVFSGSSPNPHAAHLWLSTGTSLRSAYIWGAGNLIDELALGDFDGDGRTDLLNFASGSNASQLHVTLSNRNKYPDLMTEVEDGLGAVTKFEYSPITSSSVYFGSTSLAGLESDTVNFAGPLYVVSKHEVSDGVGGLYPNVYKYRGAKTNRRYGFMGFSEIRRNHLTGKVEFTNYEQRNLLVCKVKSRTVANSRVTQGNSDSVETYGWSISPGNAPHRVTLSSSTEKVYEGANLISDDLYQYTYDNYGNVLTEKTIWPGVGSYEEQVKTYTNNTVDWILGLPDAVQIQNFRPIATPIRMYSFVYDDTNGLLMQSTDHLSGNKSRSKIYQYDQFGNVTQLQIVGTQLTARDYQFQYDTFGRYQLRLTNPLLHQTNMTRSPKYGEILSITDPNNNTISMQYDGFGREVLETKPDGVITQTEICPLSEASYSTPLTKQWTKITTSGKPTRTSFVDSLNREVRNTQVGFQGQMILSDTVYNSLFQVEKSSNPYILGAGIYWSNYTYDTKGRLKTLEEPDGHDITYDYSASALALNPHPFSPAQLNPNLIWRKVSITDANGKTEQIINRLDQVNQVRRLNFSNQVLSTMTYNYDALSFPVGIADSVNNITSRVYQDDFMTQLNDPNKGLINYEYNVLGELIRSTDALGQIIQFSYDKLGRLIFRDDDGDRTNQWAYDIGLGAIGNITNITDSTGFQESYIYDALGRNINIATTIPGTNPVPPIFLTSFTYDPFSRLDTVRYPGTSNFTVKYFYSPEGYLREAREWPTNALFWRADSMNAALQVLTETYGNGLSNRYTYDPAKFKTEAIESGYLLNGAPLASKRKHLVYEIFFTDSVLRRANLTGLPNSDIQEFLGHGEFFQDWRERLTSTTVAKEDWVLQQSIILDSRQYNYNQIGNIIHKSDISGPNPNYSYPLPGSPRPHAVTQICHGPCSNFTYDANGNMLSGRDIKNGGTRNFIWYPYNKLKSITKGSDSVDFSYGPDLDKTKQDVDGVSGLGTTYYVGNLYEREYFSANNSVQRFYIYADSRNPIAMRSLNPNETDYYHYDNLGSLDLITDESGVKIEDLSFDPHGLRRKPDWTKATNTISSIAKRGFTGHEHLDPFGLIDMKGRFYDPSMGRFISPDPFTSEPFYSESFNGYSYVNNDPVSYVDPTGYYLQCPGAVSSIWTNFGLGLGLSAASSGSRLLLSENNIQRPDALSVAKAGEIKAQLERQSEQLKRINSSAAKVGQKPFKSLKEAAEWNRSLHKQRDSQGEIISEFEANLRRAAGDPNQNFAGSYLDRRNALLSTHGFWLRASIRFGGFAGNLAAFDGVINRAGALTPNIRYRAETFPGSRIPFLSSVYPYGGSYKYPLRWGTQSFK